MSKNIKMGWKCPECGTVYAPHVNECTRYHAPVNVWPYYLYPYQVRPWWERTFVSPYGEWYTGGVSWTDNVIISSGGTSGTIFTLSAGDASDGGSGSVGVSS